MRFVNELFMEGSPREDIMKILPIFIGPASDCKGGIPLMSFILSLSYVSISQQVRIDGDQGLFKKKMDRNVLNNSNTPPKNLVIVEYLYIRLLSRGARRVGPHMLCSCHNSSLMWLLWIHALIQAICAWSYVKRVPTNYKKDRQRLQIDHTQAEAANQREFMHVVTSVIVYGRKFSRLNSRSSFSRFWTISLKPSHWIFRVTYFSRFFSNREKRE